MFIARNLLALAGYLKTWSDNKLWITAILCLLLVVAVRFNRNSLLVNRPLNDARYFIAYVEYFRGLPPTEVIRPASNWRLLVPYCAAWLPLAPLTAINVVNVLFLVLGLWALFNSAITLGINRELSFIGLGLFIFSFPTFYYSTIGYVDAAAVGLGMLCVYFTLKQKIVWVMLFFVLGFLAKETILVIIPFAAVYYWLKGRRGLAMVALIGLSMLYIIFSLLVRKYAYLTPGETNHLFWQFSAQNITLNVTRLNSVLAPVLGFGLVGYLYIAAFKNKVLAINKAFVYAGIIMVMAALFLYALAFMATYADARPIWMAYPAMILTVLLWLQVLQQRQG